MEEFAVGTSVLGVFGAIYGVIALVSSGIGIVMYILQALGLYNMSKSLNLSNPWLCFIPLVNTYSFGKVAEQYVKQDGKRSARFGVWLLVLNILQFIAIIAIVIVTVLLIIGISGFESTVIEDSSAVRTEILSFIIPFIVVYFITLAIAIALSIMQYVALWRIFAMFSNNNATLFLVLSILFSFLMPIFLFIIRNNQPKVTYAQRIGIEVETEAPII